MRQDDDKALSLTEFARGVTAAIEEMLVALGRKEKKLASSTRLAQFMTVLALVALAVNYWVDGDGQTLMTWLFGLAVLGVMYSEDRRRETARQIALIEGELYKRHIIVKRDDAGEGLCVVPVRWSDSPG